MINPVLFKVEIYYTIQYRYNIIIYKDKIAYTVELSPSGYHKYYNINLNNFMKVINYD